MQKPVTEKEHLSSDTLVAVDLGSNSFHMLIARITDDGGIQIIDKLREMIRIGDGLDDSKNLTEESQQRALMCLGRFSQRLRDIKATDVKIVATNTLRSAKNASSFIRRAQAVLGHEIDIISGMEEARLIYLGVSHSLADDGNNRLVIDIGGGSTETIIGKKFSPILMESLYMGCVSITKRFFPDGKISKKRLKKANIAARVELERIYNPFLKVGWDQAVGASGSIRSISRIVKQLELTDGNITPRSMKALYREILEVDNIDNLSFPGLGDDRRPVFIGGFIILNALIDIFNIKKLHVSDGAVREGLIYDLLGRVKHEDVRENTIKQISERYSIYEDQAKRVTSTSLLLLDEVKKEWELGAQKYANLLRWASALHEIGLTIAHAGYHRHGAYLVSNSDLPGFSIQEQQFIADLINAHRQEFPITMLPRLSSGRTMPVMRLSILLRLSVILNRSRSDNKMPDIRLKAGKRKLKMIFQKQWLENNTLTNADLQYEVEYLKSANFTLIIPDILTD